MSPSPRAAWLLGAAALTALVLPPGVAVLLALAVVAATAVDAWAVRAAPEAERRLPPVLSRGVAHRYEAGPAGPPLAGRVRWRQAMPPDLDLEPREADGRLEATLVPGRRGRHVLPGVADRREGPLGLGRWTHGGRPGAEVLVYPDMPTAWRLVRAVRRGRFREQGRLTRGPLGLGTDFESIREYLPDDDVRQVNWPATARVGRPMSNQYRVEQDREVLLLVDLGRLMAAPATAVADRTRLDATLDAAVAVALVADEVGDRCGVVAFDREVRRRLPARRAGGEAVVRAVFDLEPRPVEADYETAFRVAEGGKRALVLVLTDLVDEAAARPLVAAVPVLARRHHVVIAAVLDDALEARVATPPTEPLDVYAAAAALDLLDARRRVARSLEHAGATVVDARAGALPAACVRAYLGAKLRARV